MLFYVPPEARRILDRVSVGDVNSILGELPTGYFDAIVCNDVLGHLTDPCSVLDRLKANLAPGGRLISSLPDIRHFRTFFDLVWKKLGLPRKLNP